MEPRVGPRHSGHILQQRAPTDRPLHSHVRHGVEPARQENFIHQPIQFRMSCSNPILRFSSTESFMSSTANRILANGVRNSCDVLANKDLWLWTSCSMWPAARLKLLANRATSSRPSTATRAVESPAPSDSTRRCKRSRRRDLPHRDRPPRQSPTQPAPACSGILPSMFVAHRDTGHYPPPVSQVNIRNRRAPTVGQSNIWCDARRGREALTDRGDRLFRLHQKGSHRPRAQGQSPQGFCCSEAGAAPAAVCFG